MSGGRTLWFNTPLAPTTCTILTELVFGITSHIIKSIAFTALLHAAGFIIQGDDAMQ